MFLRKGKVSHTSIEKFHKYRTVESRIGVVYFPLARIVRNVGDDDMMVEASSISNFPAFQHMGICKMP
jgi:hypothetical protein